MKERTVGKACEQYLEDPEANAAHPFMRALANHTTRFTAASV